MKLKSSYFKKTKLTNANWYELYILGYPVFYGSSDYHRYYWFKIFGINIKFRRNEPLPGKSILANVYLIENDPDFNQGHSRSQTENSYKGFSVFMFGVAIFGVVCLIFNI